MTIADIQIAILSCTATFLLITNITIIDIIIPITYGKKLTVQKKSKSKTNPIIPRICILIFIIAIINGRTIFILFFSLIPL